MGLSDLKEIDDFQLFKKYIKNFIIQNEDLYRLIYFSNSNPYDEDSCPYPEEPRDIFVAEKEHGCVLFRRKNDIVQNEETTNILIDFTSAKLGNSKFIDSVFITIRIITKGVNIQELANGLARHSTIAKLIDSYLSHAKINNVDEVQRQSYNDISLNEENAGYLLIYSCANFGNKLDENKNYISGIRKKW